MEELDEGWMRMRGECVGVKRKSAKVKMQRNAGKRECVCDLGLVRIEMSIINNRAANFKHQH